jgi:hypothetical protein
VREYAQAVRRDVQPERFCVRIAVELDQDRERDLLVAWLRIALFSTFVGNNQSRAESTDSYLLKAINRETVDLLCHGSVVVAFRRLPAERFFVGYEFEVDGQTYCYVMRGDQNGGIVHGRLDEHVWRGGSVRGGSTRSSDRLLVDEEIGNSSEQDICFDFNPGRLLPGEGEFIQLAGQPLFNWQETGTIHEFMRLFGFGVENRAYMLDVVMAPLFAEVMVINECRGVARHIYGADELATEAASHPTADVPLELLHLKVGDQAERHRFARTQDFFRELTGVDFDIHLLPESAANDDSAADRLFRIDVDITEGPVAVPLAFSGAGRWEALVLSTALTGNGTVTILDEPAINLHPTLQRRLLSAVRNSPSQTLLITHSPFLVPAGGPAEIDRVIRVGRADGRTTIHRTRLSERATRKEATVASKVQRFMMASSDVRALLFANAVLLVEGDTDMGAQETWLPAIAAQSNMPPPDDLNLVIASAGGDTAFAIYINYLEAFGIPWTIFCDGKVLHPNYQHTLCKQLPDVSHDGRPADGEVFDAWREYWASIGVFTLAGSFDEEIEAVLCRIDANLWSKVQKQYDRSKVRAGRAFAEQIPPPERLGEIYSAMLEHLGLATTPPP